MCNHINTSCISGIPYPNCYNRMVCNDCGAVVQWDNLIRSGYSRTINIKQGLDISSETGKPFTYNN